MKPMVLKSEFKLSLESNSLNFAEFQFLERSRDAAVLADAPEVDRHQHGDAERQADAVQHVEPQQRALADERAAEQREPRIVGRVNQRHVAQRAAAAAPGPSWPRNGVARAMFEPTVIAQIAS